MNYTPKAYCIHCFAHQLQLALVAVTKRNDSCGWLFEILSNLFNVVGVSFKRREMIRNIQAQEVTQALEVGENFSGSGLDQECYTNDLCIALQIREQDIVNAMELVTFTKSVLQKMREQGWETLLYKVTLFCTKHGIDVPTMDARRSRRFVEKATNLHHFRVKIFLGVIDLHLQELDNRFSERSMELLACMSCLSSKDNFSSFDKEKVLKLASFYPEEFSSFDLMTLEGQLDIFMDYAQ
ncbi:uncharacterized protein LOC110737319 [Chenopodium quinoa]|uniref:uncharacterized protein LOC110737319 n=1 Tax=Chenopodium quinoa TaxID=63459 RepID=UPI000B7996D7|nr:uncharacterized protein LOC110737319 [Chenopodium quinoa]